MPDFETLFITHIDLIIYIIGLLGICLGIYLICTKFNKRNWFFSLITSLILAISIILISTGGISTFFKKKTDEKAIAAATKKEKEKENETAINTSVNSSENDKQNNSDSPDTNTVKTSNSKSSSNTPKHLDEVSFEYKIKNSQCYILISNYTDKVFNGSVSVTVGGSTTSLPISNLLPSKRSNYTIPSNNATEISDYKLDGTYSDKATSTQKYAISSMGTGNGYFRFEVIPTSYDEETLKSICKTFKSTYSSDKCKGILIYFLNENASTLDNSYAEYYCNNEGTTSQLVIYSTNQKITID